MTSISVYIAQYIYGWYDERETVIAYAGLSLIDAESAIKSIQTESEVRTAWISEWVDGKYVQQLEIITQCSR